MNRGALARLFINAFPAMGAGDQRLALVLYRLLAGGRSVSPARLASSLNRPVEDIQRVLGRWPGVFYDDAGAVIGFWGLTVKEMRQRLELNGNTVYAWCAWDTLFLPALLDATANIASRCAQTGEPVRLTVSPGRIESVDPASVVVSFLEPDESELRENVTKSFCHFVHFFRDHEAGKRWVARHPGMFLLTLEEAFDIGRRVNAARYRDVLQAIGEIPS
ncbi:MAG TPA: alkylmercury lyase MerB [Burkholderiales bacterium]|nr:alkylmercury lyase MerB [Burkholderiales bacterium]